MQHGYLSPNIKRIINLAIKNTKTMAKKKKDFHTTRTELRDKMKEATFKMHSNTDPKKAEALEKAREDARKTYIEYVTNPENRKPTS
jgi:uncharacterized protein (DUF302 family)